MKFIDLFAGIGGFRSGMEQAGHTCIGYVENNKYARQSYQAIYDNQGVWTKHDIRNITASTIPPASCWCLGFPCQDISTAGKQKGLRKSNRSSLFYCVTNLLNQLPQTDRPAYLFIENVKNLLSVNHGFDFLRILLELDKNGYDAEWEILDTAQVLPQHRERIYIIGHLRTKGTQQVFPIRLQHSKAETRLLTSSSQETPVILQRARGKNHGSRHTIAPTLTSSAYQDNHILYYRNELRKLTPLECWRLQGFSDQQYYQAQQAGLSDSQLYKQAGNAASVPVIKLIAQRLLEY